jgi:ribosomal protein L37AE/L43A
MPLESIACTSCGATDVQEVKADTYFCNHCEGVFKYTKPRFAGGPAVCEVDGCGVLAIRRCVACSGPFCQGHSAVGSVERCCECRVKRTCCFCASQPTDRCGICSFSVCSDHLLAAEGKRCCPDCLEAMLKRAESHSTAQLKETS